jgi:hypothetical protein
MTDPRCTCPTTRSPSGEPVRYLDQACPVHGQKTTGCCPTCGTVRAPIVQTIEVAREMVEKGEKTDE